MDINLSKSISMGMPKQAMPSRNSLMEVVLLVIVCVLFGWFIILPKRAEVSAEQSDLSQIQSQEQQISQKLSSLQAMAQQLNSDTQDVSELDQALPLDGNTPELQILINNLAQAAGVTVGDISISGQPDAIDSGNKALLSDPYGVARSLQTLSGTVYVIGSFSQLQAFLEKVEASGRLLDITDLQMDAATGGNLNLRLDVDAYYLGSGSD